MCLFTVRLWVHSHFRIQSSQLRPPQPTLLNPHRRTYPRPRSQSFHQPYPQPPTFWIETILGRTGPGAREGEEEDEDVDLFAFLSRRPPIQQYQHVLQHDGQRERVVVEDLQAYQPQYQPQFGEIPPTPGGASPAWAAVGHARSSVSMTTMGWGL
ncbi:hypothetical protein BDN72DRAFT_904866 [Pluteus cervinus]|uniref:Uncharacterized protein n=1 Tax=Pluteus cervinus TaxID=181527 RepID=A0ACD3A589_9AGAR|nr:hypothetical protein BDN72DRAFT_904866 [Pluteus cervinus]